MPRNHHFGARWLDKIQGVGAFLSLFKKKNWKGVYGVFVRFATKGSSKTPEKVFLGKSMSKTFCQNS
jgi:hypothetical protein